MTVSLDFSRSLKQPAPRREEPSEHWHWAESYGFSAAQWDEMVNGSKVTEEYLKLLIEKGAASVIFAPGSASAFAGSMEVGNSLLLVHQTTRKRRQHEVLLAPRD
jgi:hypothetical protein